MDSRMTSSCCAKRLPLELCTQLFCWQHFVHLPLTPGCGEEDKCWTLEASCLQVQALSSYKREMGGNGKQDKKFLKAQRGVSLP